MNSPKDDSDHDEGQVSEVNQLKKAEPISPGDAVAGYPDSESGHPHEGAAGPNAPAKRNRPLPDRKAHDD